MYIFNNKLLIFVISVVLLFIISKNIVKIEFLDVVDLKKDVNVDLSKKQIFNDCKYLFDIISDNYPYIDVSQRQFNFSWNEDKDNFLLRAKECNNIDDLKLVISEQLDKLGNAHTRLLNEEEVSYIIDTYDKELSNSPNSWQNIILEKLNAPKVNKRYKLDNTNLFTNEINNIMSRNVICADLIHGKLGYIYIPAMKQKSNRSVDEKIINQFLDKVKKYNALVIDIRYNSGGDTSYWQEYLVPNLADRQYNSKTYNFYKDGVVSKEYIDFQVNNSDYHANNVSNLDTNVLKTFSNEIIENFKYYEETDTVIVPNNDSIKFSGNIYLLVNDYVYSSSEAFAIFCKQSNFATLIGSKTGGDGIGSDPWVEVLPNSGLVITFPKSLGVDELGVINEEFKTSPDYFIESVPNWSNILEDSCIKKVIELEDLN